MILPKKIIYRSGIQELQEWQAKNGTWIIGYVPYMIAMDEKKEIAEQKVYEMLINHDIIKEQNEPTRSNF